MGYMHKNKVIRLLIYVCLITGLLADTGVSSAKKAAPKLRVRTKKIILTEGKSKRIKWNVQPRKSRKKVSFKSSNKKVAKVSARGVVKAKKKGKATITVRLKISKKKVKKVRIRVVVKRKYRLVKTPTPTETEAPAKTPMPTETTAPVGTQKSTAYIAHRGYSMLAPENTLPAFELAVQSGFWGVECDVWLSQDGEFVISHAESIKKMCGVDKKISELTWGEIKTYPIVAGNNVAGYPDLKSCLLDSYLKVISSGKNTKAVIELKMEKLTPEEAERILSLLDKYDMRSRTVFLSFKKDNLLRIKEKKDERIGFQFLSWKYKNEEVEWCRKNGIDYSVYFEVLTPETVAAIRKAGLKIAVWAVDDKKKADDLIKNYAVDYLTSNTKLF